MAFEYNQEAALAFVQQHLLANHLVPKAIDEGDLPSLLKNCQQLDMEYMQSVGVTSGESYYDDDDAFEHISDRLIPDAASSEQEMALCELVDAYLDAHQMYLEDAGLLDWE